MYIHADQPASELIKRLLGTAVHIQSLAENRSLTDPGTLRRELEGIRQRMARDVEAIDEYLKTYTDKKEER